MRVRSGARTILVAWRRGHGPDARVTMSTWGSCCGDLFDPTVMRLNIRLHRLDAQRLKTACRLGKQRRNRLALRDRRHVGGTIADQQALGDGLIAIQLAVDIVTADPGARRNG